MANVLINEDTMTDIADAIRSKKGVSTTYKPNEMPSAIESISGGGVTPTGTKNISITQNGTTTEDVTNYASAQITVNVETAMEKITVSGTSVTQELTANKFYVFGEVTALTITLATPVNQNIVNEYHFRFTSGATATVLTLPQSVTMPSDFAVEASKTYEISIVDGFGTVTAW